MDLEEGLKFVGSQAANFCLHETEFDLLQRQRQFLHPALQHTSWQQAAFFKKDSFLHKESIIGERSEHYFMLQLPNCSSCI